jgi:hypothetical protein
MKIILDMIHLLNKDSEDIILIEKLKKFNHKFNKNSHDVEKVLLLFETLYSDLTDLNKQYPYLNDIVLCLVDVLDKVIKDNKRKTKNEYFLKQTILKMRDENDTLHNDNTKLICENAHKAISNPLVECNNIINGSYTIITGRSIELNTQTDEKMNPSYRPPSPDKSSLPTPPQAVYDRRALHSHVDEELLLDKDATIQDLKATIEILELKIGRLEKIQYKPELMKKANNLQLIQIDELIFEESKLPADTERRIDTERNTMITSEKTLKVFDPTNLTFSYSDVSMCRLPSSIRSNPLVCTERNTDIEINTGTDRNIMITSEKTLKVFDPTNLTFSYSDVSMCRLPSSIR